MELRYVEQVGRAAFEDARAGVMVEDGRVPEDVDHARAPTTVSCRWRVESTSIRSGPMRSVSI